MREIKFMAWDEKNKLYIFFDKTDILDGYGFELIDFSIPWSDWDQFTGLHDKNGKEIYEGDIVNDGAVVEWFDKLFYDSCGAEHSGYYCKKWFDMYDGELSWHNGFNDCEIIGNIHENPELIK